ncbi:MAG: hypothetical protein ACT4UP_08695 [Gammaproteobacteria bacterium]
MQESLLVYRRMRYLWVAGALAALAIVGYALHRPAEPPNGGTWLGYTLGGVAAALVLLLAAFGIRKRAYAATLGTVRGWLSAHVYLGLALVVVMTLHAGFQFGWNVHTLAYVLVCVVVASGIVGVWFYLRYPEQMSRNRAGETRDQMLAELADLDRLCAKQAAGLGGDYPDVVMSARDRAALGGSAYAILAGRDKSRIVLPGAHAGGGHSLPNAGQARLLDWLGQQLAESTDGERTRLIHELMTLVNTRKGVLDRLRRDAQIRGWLDAWLFVHIPATAALLAALAAHVLVVFLYW